MNNSSPSFFFKRPSSFSYTLGKLTTATDPLNHTTTYEYDGLGRLIRIIHPDTAEITYNRYCCGLESITDENGHITQYEHYPVNLLKKVTDALGNEITYQYDHDGKLTKVIDATNA